MADVFKLRARGAPGPATTASDGKSAYELAVDNGFVGTEEEWLESLQGADGTVAAADTPTTAALLDPDKAVTPEGLGASGVLVNESLDAQARIDPLVSDVATLMAFTGLSGLSKGQTVDAVMPRVGPDGQLALIDVWVRHDFYWCNGRRYPSKEAFLAGLNGTADGDAMIIGDFRSGDNLVTNTALVTDTGWNEGAGCSNAVVNDGGQQSLVTTGGGGNPTLSYWLLDQVAPASRCYALGATLKDGTVAASPVLSGGSAATLNQVSSAAVTSGGGYAAREITLSVNFDTPDAYFGPRSGSTTGDHYMRAPFAYNTRPFPGFTQGEITIEINSVTPPAGSGTVVAFALDANGTRDRIRLEYNKTTTTLAWLGYANNVQWLTSFSKVIAPETAFTTVLALSHDDSDCFFDNDAKIHDGNCAIPGVQWLRLFTSLTGEDWDGEIDDTRVTIYAERASEDFCRARCAAAAAPRAYIGDSYNADTGTGVLPSMIEVVDGVPALNIGVGGSTFTRAVKDYLGRPALLSHGLQVWDGSSNRMTFEAILRGIQQVAWAHPTGRILYIPPISAPDDADWEVHQQTLNLLVEVPQLITSTRVKNPLTELIATNPTDSRALLGMAPTTAFVDGRHLTTTAKQALDGPLAAANAAVDALDAEPIELGEPSSYRLKLGSRTSAKQVTVTSASAGATTTGAAIGSTGWEVLTLLPGDSIEFDCVGNATGHAGLKSLLLTYASGAGSGTLATLSFAAAAADEGFFRVSGTLWVADDATLRGFARLVKNGAADVIEHTRIEVTGRALQADGLSLYFKGTVASGGDSLVVDANAFSARRRGFDPLEVY